MSVPRLASLLHPSRIRLNLQQPKRTAAIHEIARLLEGHSDVINFTGFYNELLARERLDSTCIGNEIALPHARTEHVSSLVLSVGRSNDGVFFENCGQTVRLIFVIATPKAKAGDYLTIVSTLCRAFKDGAVREGLLKAATEEDFIRILVEAEERHLSKPAQG